MRRLHIPRLSNGRIDWADVIGLAWVALAELFLIGCAALIVLALFGVIR